MYKRVAQPTLTGEQVIDELYRKACHSIEKRLEGYLE
jgi:hypothetical protein